MVNTDLIVETAKFDDSVHEIHEKFIGTYPVLYIIYNEDKKLAYIGQTVHIQARMHQHRDNKQRKKLTDVMVIGNKKFNQSATYNIETNLINNFIGDEKYELQNVSQTSEKQVHDYYQKDLYNNEIFEDIWDRLLDEKLVDNTLDQIENKDIYKVSPYKELTSKQLEIKGRILEYCEKNINKKTHKVFVISGEAGTGKSVVVASLYNTLQDLSKDSSSNLYKSNNYLLVNHPEMRKTYESLADRLPNLKKNHILRPTTFINDFNKEKIKDVGVTVIDEGHLLLTSKDNYNNFRYDNQLEEIIKRSKITVFIFDDKQILKLKSNWSDQKFSQFKNKYHVEDGNEYKLTQQMRMAAPQEVEDWINSFVRKEILPIPKSTDKFTFKIEESAEALKKDIFSLNDKYSLSRIVSTFDYEHHKDGGTYIVDKDGINMPWNTTNSNRPWAERDNTINEVGSIYTVQGFDLRNVGVVLGPSIDYDKETDKLVIDVNKYKDTEAFKNVDKLGKEEERQTKEKIILNSINILMKRGINGLYIYAVNKKLREKLLELKNGCKSKK